MNQDNHEQQLSAMLDGESAASPSRHAMASTDELAKLRRYQLIGEVMRQQQRAPLVHPNWGQELSQRLLQEPTVLAPVKPIKPAAKWHRAATGLGIAASVTMVSLYLAPYWMQDVAMESAAPMQIAATTTQPKSAIRTVALTPSSRLTPERERQFSRYLMEHGEVASTRGMGPMLPYASLVSYEKQGR